MSSDTAAELARTRGLLDAVEQVFGDLSLDAVLRSIAEAARDLVDARYAALAVNGPDGGMEQFIPVGFTEEQATTIGHIPERIGVLGQITEYPGVLRLADIGSHPSAVGFPLGHPPMSSFLGAPIRIRGEVYGELYLSESRHGAFSDQDAALVTSLAAAAASAISHARQYRDAQTQQRWLAATADINARLAAGDGDDPLELIARHSATAADADLVTVALLSDGGEHLTVAVSVGDDALRGRRIGAHEVLAGEALRRRSPALVRAASGDPLGGGPQLALPLASRDGERGVLTIARDAGRPPFTPAELDMAAAFADHAGVALELAEARTDHQRMLVLEDRDRIARDLHDHVIQELFAIGLQLQALSGRVRDRAVADNLSARVDDLDRTVRQIRASIFELRGPVFGGTGLRQRVLGVADDITAALGFRPVVTFAGAVDTATSPRLADDVVACVREGLSNTARHAHARHSAVQVEAGADAITVTVSDDGAGVPADSRLSGLKNLRDRAEAAGGRFAVGTPEGGGTALTWTAPLDT